MKKFTKAKIKPTLRRARRRVKIHTKDIWDKMMAIQIVSTFMMIGVLIGIAVYMCSSLEEVPRIDVQAENFVETTTTLSTTTTSETTLTTTTNTTTTKTTSTTTTTTAVNSEENESLIRELSNDQDIVENDYAVEEYSEEELGETDDSITSEPDIVMESNYEIDQTETYESGETLLGTYEATWYTAVDMGYTSTPYGSSGRYLESGYSIASNSIPQGSIVHIIGLGLDGYYRVDDCGGMANNVIDMYYWDRSFIPYEFKKTGRGNIQVYLVE